jgi:acetyl-CoA acetyltransferase
MRASRRVAVLGGVRIPFCRNNTAYFDVGNLGMSVKTLGALVEKFGLQGEQLGEVAMGAVLKHSSDWNLGREAALSSGLSPLTPGITIQRACGTGLDTVITIANKIALGQIEAGIGGGSDTTSDVPIAVNPRLRRRLLNLNMAKTNAARFGAAFKGFSFREFKPEFPGVGEPRTGKSMGEHCELMAKEWRISRAAQVLCTLAAWESPEFCRDKLGLSAPLGPIDRSKLNVVGSSLAFGHPFAATGARIVATAAKLLTERGSGRALISICTAGGMGVAAILER